MNAYNMYLGAEQPPYLTSDKILAAPFQKNKDQVAKAMNEGFQFYYRAHRAARDIGADALLAHRNTVSSKAIWDLRSAIQKDLRDAASTRSIGFGFGDSLYTCFKHLESTGGVWKDDNWDGRTYFNIPMGLSAFLEQTKTRETKIVSQYNDWKSSVDASRRSREAKDWSKLGDNLGYAQTAVDYMGPFLWSKLKVNDKSAKEWSSLMSKFIGYGKDTHDHLDRYVAVTSGGVLGERVLAEAAAMVLEKLPIFGTLYAGVIRGLPDVVQWFRNYGAATSQAIDSIGRR